MARTEEDRLQRDLKWMKNLNITHKHESLLSELPVHLKTTFRNVVLLGKQCYEEYDDSNVAAARLSIWRQHTKERARELSDTAGRLLREDPTEQTWRLKLEPLVDAAFRHNIECPNPACKGRLWRSEIEVCTESVGPITNSLEERRNARKPCRCQSSEFPGLNQLFSDKADEFIQHTRQSASGLGTLEMPKRKPDRVYGLRQTANFEQKLSRPVTLLRESANAEALVLLEEEKLCETEETVMDQLLSPTPFKAAEDPLLFPFLVVEAKSEDGNGFRSCGIQTALPLWALLNLQDRLQKLTQPMAELGGPLVWYIAYRGDEWRVSAFCGTSPNSMSFCQIIDLWSGRVSSPDGALQLLLIMDYIFDWARDLYRPSIYRLLGFLSSQDGDDQASLASDSDIYSLRRTFYDDMASDIYSDPSSSTPYQNSPPGEELLSGWKKHDITAEYRSGIKPRIRAFRPACVVKHVFECLYITRDNIGTLMASLGTSNFAHKSKAKAALTALRQSPLRTTDRVLSQMEDHWTGTPRASPSSLSSRDLFVSIAFHTLLSDRWDIQKVITCFAVDQDTLDTMRKISGLKSKPAILDGVETTAPILDEATIIGFLDRFRNRSIHENMLLALSNRVEQFGPPLPSPTLSQPFDVTRNDLNALSSSQPAPYMRKSKKRKIDADQSISINALIGINYSSLLKIVADTYKAHKQPGMLEPDYDYLRFSSQFEEVKHLCLSVGLPESYKTLIPVEIPGMELGLFLVCDTSRPREHLCVYFTEQDPGEPDTGSLLSALRQCIDQRLFAVLDRRSIYRGTVVPGFEDPHNPNVRVEATKHIIPSIKNAAKSWHSLLKKNLPQDRIDDEADVSAEEKIRLPNEFYDTPFVSVVRVKRNRHAYIVEQPREHKSRHNESRKENPRQPWPRIEVASEPEESDVVYARDMAIAQILSEAEGDGLSEEQMGRLIELGHFK